MHQSGPRSSRHDLDPAQPSGGRASRRRPATRRRARPAALGAWTAAAVTAVVLATGIGPSSTGADDLAASARTAEAGSRGNGNGNGNGKPPGAPAPTAAPSSSAAPTAQPPAGTPAPTGTPSAPATGAPQAPAQPSGSGDAAATSTGTPDGSAAPSRVDWRSGVYVPGSDPALNEAFAQWRGRDLDVAVDWSARATWEDIVAPTWLYDAWRGTPYDKVFGVAMLPEADPTVTMSACARGDYDDRWREFGANIRTAGLADETIVRLGWEFNGDWYRWAAWNAGEWADCWRRIVTAAERTAPELRWEWTVNRGAGQALTDARQAYPGDAYVDVVGVDSYDMWPGVLSDADWREHLDGDYGLRFWADFARERGKPLSVPEWGVFPGTRSSGENGGDNELYVRRMVEFFDSLGSLLAYEAYFNDSAPYYAGSLWGPVQNPEASAAYRAAYAG